MEYILEDGTVLTNEMVDEMADKIEREGLPGKTVKILIAPVGRPMVSDEELAMIGVKVPLSWKAKLDAKAAMENLTRSQYLRKVISDAIL